MLLPKDIIANILSDYIEYDELLLLIDHISCLKINPKRIQISEEFEENIAIQKTYIDGDLRKIETFADGQKIVEVNYRNGRLDGENIAWYDNGQKMYEHQHRDGMTDGISCSWNRDGIKIFEGNYKNGKLDGKYFHWDDNGNISRITRYKNNKFEGEQLYYQPNGEIALQEIYEDGELIIDPNQNINNIP